MTPDFPQGNAGKKHTPRDHPTTTHTSPPPHTHTQTRRRSTDRRFLFVTLFDRISFTLQTIEGCSEHCSIINLSFSPQKLDFYPPGVFYYKEIIFLFFNPFTAQACKMSGLKGAHIHLQTVYFSVPQKSYFQCCVLKKILSHTNAKKKTQTFSILHFAPLLVVFKGHHCSERVDGVRPQLWLQKTGFYSPTVFSHSFHCNN